MSVPLTPTPEIDAAELTPERWRDEILPAARPMVLRRLVRDWPAVHAAEQSPEAAIAYLRRFDRGATVGAMIGPASINGRFFYDAQVTGFNFRKQDVKLAGALDTLLATLGEARPTALAVQSVPAHANLPGFEAENPLPLLSDVEPRIWIGNRVTIAAHHDPSENIACVMAGKRRFTLFPPEQVANLYPGPFELTPAGPVISMVDFDAPDLVRFPGFADALQAASVADLVPGDAIYIPYLWWHHVRSLDRLNVLVNFWWTPATASEGRPLDAFLHAMLSIKDLPEPHRQAWRALFDHYVFDQRPDPGAHLPEAARGVLAPMRSDIAARLKGALMRALGE